MFIEMLEPRIAPSGVVELVFTQKLLTLKDPVGTDSTLSITASASGELTITPDAATALKLEGTVLADGQALMLPFFSGGINAALGVGADHVTFSGHFAGDVKVDLGNGNNFLTLDGANISRGFLLKGGADQDFVQFNGSNLVAGAFSANFGNGENYVFGGLTSLTVGKNLTLQGGTGYNGLSLNFGSLNVGGNVRFTGNGTHNQLNISTSDEIRIGGSLSLISTNGVEVGFNIFGNNGVFIGGNVMMKAADVVHVNAGLGSSAGSVHVSGTVSINTGKLAGINPLYVTAGQTLFIGKSLTILASPDLRPEVRGSDENGPSFIGGAVTIKGARTASITMDGTIAGKLNVSVIGGDGRNLFVASATPEGTLRLMGAVSISTSGSTANGLTFIDHVVAESSFTIKDAGGDRVVEIHDALIAGALSIDTGAGADTVTLVSSGDQGNLCLLGALKILTGAGLDAISLGGNDPGTGVSSRGASIRVDGGSDLATYVVGTASLLEAVPVLKNLVP
jgi:hypothetical protein